jgi:hypothetical protein
MSGSELMRANTTRSTRPATAEPDAHTDAAVSARAAAASQRSAARRYAGMLTDVIVMGEACQPRPMSTRLKSRYY